MKFYKFFIILYAASFLISPKELALGADVDFSGDFLENVKKLNPNFNEDAESRRKAQSSLNQADVIGTNQNNDSQPNVGEDSSGEAENTQALGTEVDARIKAKLSEVTNPDISPNTDPIDPNDTNGISNAYVYDDAEQKIPLIDTKQSALSENTATVEIKTEQTQDQPPSVPAVADDSSVTKNEVKTVPVTEAKKQKVDKVKTSKDRKFEPPTKDEVQMIEGWDKKLYNEVLDRPVYDYRTTILPSSINKKVYGEENQHLPKVFYNEEYSALLFVAVAKNNVQDIKALLHKEADINAQDSRNGYTPLIYAVKNNKINAVRYLITRGANLNKQAFDGNTALHIAMMTGNLQITEILLSANPDINIVNNQGYIAFDYLPKDLSYRSIVKLLKSYRNITTGLLDLVTLGNIEVIKYALQNGANINARTHNPPNDTPLIIAIKRKDNAMANFLILNGADIYKTNGVGLSPIAVANQTNNKEMLDMLRTILIQKDLEKVMLYEENANSIEVVSE